MSFWMGRILILFVTYWITSSPAGGISKLQYVNLKDVLPDNVLHEDKNRVKQQIFWTLTIHTQGVFKLIT